MTEPVHVPGRFAEWARDLLAQCSDSQTRIHVAEVTRGHFRGGEDTIAGHAWLPNGDIVQFRLIRPRNECNPVTWS